MKLLLHPCLQTPACPVRLLGWGHGHTPSHLQSASRGSMHALMSDTPHGQSCQTHCWPSGRGKQDQYACAFREVFAGGMGPLNSTTQTELQALFDIIGTPHWADVEALQSPAWRKYLQRLPGKAPTLYRYIWACTAISGLDRSSWDLWADIEWASAELCSAFCFA